MPTDDNHHLNSTLRERIVEHLFIGEALRALWKLRVMDAELLKSEFDGHGYDLVLSRGLFVRHIQFKTSLKGKPDQVSISKSLASRPSGCVIWIHLDEDLKLGPYFFFGGDAGQPLPSLEAFKIAKRATHNKNGYRPERLNHCLVPGKHFEEITSLEQLLTRLLGKLSGAPS